MKRFLKPIALVLVLALCLASTGCTSDLPAVHGTRLDDLSASDEAYGTTLLTLVMNDLVNRDLTSLNSIGYHAGEDDASTFEDLLTAYESFAQQYGEAQSVTQTESYKYGYQKVYIGSMTMEKGGTLNLALEFTSNYQLVMADLYETDEEAEASVTLPDTVVEEDVTVGEGTDHPLQGKITYPKDAAQSGKKYPAVVMVGGDGANDMNMTANSTHAYRDIAWALAEQGIVCVRYNERLYEYSDEADEAAEGSDAELLTEVSSVSWVYTEDANRAAELVRSYSFVDADQVFYLGHSQGAIVGSRASQEGGNYAGFILLNTSPRPWYEVIYDQYLNYGLIDYSDEQIYYIVIRLQSEYEYLQNRSWEDADDQTEDSQTLLNWPLAFWKDYLSFDYVGELEKLQKPTLIVQGGADYQITQETDFSAWQTELSGKSFATLVSFEGLNHLLTPSYGIFAGHYKEYDKPGRVPSDVTDSIGEFILQNAE